MIDGLKDKHRNAIIKALAANDRVERAVLFGSRAMETFTPGSDVDVALFGKGLTLTDQGRLAATLEESAIPQKVDLVLYNRIDNDTLRKHIRRHGIEWYKRSKDASIARLHLPAQHLAVIKALLKKYLPGVEVWAYGSRVNGRAHDGSDLDLVLRAPGLREIPDGRLTDFRDALRNSNIPFLVEARDWARLPETFHREIKRNHVATVEGSKSESERNWLYYPQFPGHWDRTPLYSVAQWTNGLAFRNIKFSPTGKPIIKIAEIKGGISGQTKFTNQTFDDSVRVRSGDLLFSWSGQPETSINAFWWRGPEGWLNQHVFRVVPIEGIDETFFFYLLRYLKPNFVAIARNKQTTGLGHITKRDLKRIEAAFPPLPEQRAIAHVLGTLDDKIELNRCMNETLEAMARALFKSWFVDFDPVHAKAALKHRTASHHSPLEGESARQGRQPAAAPVGGLRRLYSPRTLQRAKTLRQNQTDAEGLLWHFLRNRQLDGYKFRRQQPIGPYIADFACLSAKLLIELDGGHHAERSSHDEKRDQYLRDRGYRVLRFWNNDVFGNCFGVLECIRAALTAPPPHQPSPDGSASATPPQGGSDESKWTVERARAYLDRMDPKIANLFPDTLDDEGKPLEWELVSLDSLLELVYGKALKKSDRKPGPYPVHGSGGVVGYHDTSLADGPGIIVGRKGTVGSLYWEDKSFFPIDTVFYVKPLNNYSLEFIYYYLGTLGLDQMNTDAAVPGLNRNNVYRLEVLSFPVQIVSEYSKLVQSLRTKICQNKRESRTLAQTRDLLLPKLMSGEIRLAEAEKVVEAVT